MRSLVARVEDVIERDTVVVCGIIVNIMVIDIFVDDADMTSARCVAFAPTLQYPMRADTERDQRQP